MEASGFIKIAEAGLSKGKREILRLLKRPLGSIDAAEEIKSIFESSGVSRRRVRLNIPRHLVTVRFLKLPSVDEDEIRKMTKIESLKHIPYSDEDIVCGHRIIEKSDAGYSSVLIAVTRADTVRREIDTLKKAGITVESVSLGSETLLLWYLAIREAEDDSASLLVDIDDGHIDIDVVIKNSLVFTRGVLYSAARPILAEKIIEQVNISTAAYRKESGKAVSKIVLSGMQARANELKPILAQRLGIPVEVADQMKGIPMHEGAHIELEEASFVELIGLVLRYEETRIDLLPESSREAERLVLMKKNIATSLVVLALIIVTAFGAVLKKIHDRRVYISYVDSEIRKIAPQVRTEKKMAKVIGLVTSKIAERPLAIDVVSEILKITPQGITLTMMDYESRKTMTLRGTAPALSDIFKYVTILEKSAYFENVKVRYANKRVGQSSEAADFEIICPISTAKP